MELHPGYNGLKATTDQKRLCTISLIFTETFKIKAASKHIYQRRVYDPDKHLKWNFFNKVVNG